ncbi:hypothetical protein pb186bvf_002589 [Paramecium bursaria]
MNQLDEIQIQSKQMQNNIDSGNVKKKSPLINKQKETIFDSATYQMNIYKEQQKAKAQELQLEQ